MKKTKKIVILFEKFMLKHAVELNFFVAICLLLWTLVLSVLTYNHAMVLHQQILILNDHEQRLNVLE